MVDIMSEPIQTLESLFLFLLRKDIPNINQNGDSPNTPLRMALGGNGRPYGITAVRDQCPGGELLFSYL